MAGVVARDRATGLYDVVSEAELQELMDTDTELSASIRRHEMVPESADVILTTKGNQPNPKIQTTSVCGQVDEIVAIRILT